MSDPKPCACMPGDPCIEHTPKWCPQCGPCSCDEDGCCAVCGADAVGPGADAACALLAACVELLEMVEHGEWFGNEPVLARARAALDAARGQEKDGGK